MAYSEQEGRDMVKAMKEAIKKDKIKFFYQLFAYVPQSQETGTKILKNLGELGTIKRLLSNQKTVSKVKILNKWEKSDNATLQVAYFKLLADQNELDRLTVNKNQNEDKKVDKFTIIEDDQDSPSED